MHHRDISDGKYNWTDKQKRRWRARGVTLGFEEKESECASKREAEEAGDCIRSINNICCDYHDE